jgi:hypothetical protein
MEKVDTVVFLRQQCLDTGDGVASTHDANESAFFNNRPMVTLLILRASQTSVVV